MLSRAVSILLFAAACKSAAPAPSVQSPETGVTPTPVTAPVASLTAAPAPAGTATAPAATPAEEKPVAASVIAQATQACIARHGEANRALIQRGVDQVGKMWRESDGDLAAFCVEQFAPTPAARDTLFARLSEMHEQMKGHFLEIGRAARWGSEVENGAAPLPIDGLLASYDPGAHATEDMFVSKVAFAALLNFPLTNLAERIQNAAKYSRRQWAEIRLTGKFDARVPSSLLQAASAAEAAADGYIAGYYLWMHHVLAEDGTRLFPAKKHLITHWNLRDELKANYADPQGLAKQRVLIKVMDRIVTQTIPKVVIDNPNFDWNPFTNEVKPAAAGTIEDEGKGKPATVSQDREPDTRFSVVLSHFKTSRAIDAYTPTTPSRLDRAFDGAEMPEDRVRQMLVQVLESPLVALAAKEAEATLGRKLEPSDIWYQFGAEGGPEAELDKLTMKKYPTSRAFEKDIPRILRDLGFTAKRAQYVAERITVDASRGAGHAMGAERRGDKAHLRTRVEPSGMTYKGYNIAVHELGHNVEQTFSLYDIDEQLLSGVPNTAFTEALAFLFQARDLDLLGRPKKAGNAERMRAIDTFWDTREIAGQALVELDVWKWLYAHPNATAAELREATVETSKKIWNTYFAPTLGGKDVTLLGIYSHTVATPLYLFNYVLGRLIAFQVEEHVSGKDKATFAREFERVSRLGSILPDLWMTQATGKPVTPQPLLDAAKRAFEKK